MVAIDNKIEQAMVSGITASFPAPDLAAAYVTWGRTEGVGAKAVCQEPEEAKSLLPLPLEALGSLRSEGQLFRTFAVCPGWTPSSHRPVRLFAAASGSPLGRWQGRELRHSHLSAARIWQGRELIGCEHTAVPLQSLGWGQELGGNRKQSTPPLLPLLTR